MLKARGIEVRQKDSTLISGVDLAVAPGQTVAVVGPSGGGKSTLLRALAMIDPPSAGSISVNGHTFTFPESGGGTRPPWPLVTLVFQQLFLWPHLSLRDNIFLPIRMQGGFDGPGVETDGMVEDLGLTELLGRYPNEVSVGQRQRAALVRAILLRPDYLLLDEITSAQDVEHTFLIASYIRRFCEEGGAVVLASHLIGFAREAANHVSFLEGGVIVESGDVDIMEAPSSRRFRDFLAVGS